MHYVFHKALGDIMNWLGVNAIAEVCNVPIADTLDHAIDMRIAIFCFSTDGFIITAAIKP